MVQETSPSACTLSRYTPPENDLLALKSLFSKRLARFASIQNEIAIAERWLHQLQHDKDILVKSFEQYHIFMKAPRYLPDDILREIFMWCLPTGRNPTMSAKEAPMLLTQVSSQWRTAALTTPRLWSALHIAVPSPISLPHSAYNPVTGERIHPSYVANHRLEGVTEWLARSGQLPLSISLYDPDNSSDAGYGKRFVDALLPYAFRWRALSLQCPPDAGVEVARLTSSDVPLLESFHVLPTLRPIGWRNSGVLSAPKLHDISVHGLLEGFLDLPFTWEQLTNLTLMGGQWLDGSLTMAQIGEILTRCRQLRSCTLKLTGGASISRERRPLPVISLPNIEELYIYEMQAQTHFFFAAIEAPRLRVLEYWFDGTTKPSPSGFSALLAKVGRSVTRLATNPTTIDASEFTKGLWACVALTSLSLRSQSSGTSLENKVSPTCDILLKMFAQPTDGLYLCPRLDTLECLVGANYSDTAIIEFVTRKQSGADSNISKLKSVKMVITRGPAIDVNTELGPRILGSLCFDILYPPSSYRGCFSPFEGLSTLTVSDPYYQPSHNSVL